MLKVVHNYDCSKSRGMLEYLTEREVPFEIIDILADPLSEFEIRTLLKKLHLDAIDIVRTNEKLYQEKYATQNLSADGLIKMLSENPSLIQRPIVVKGKEALICRPIEKVEALLDEDVFS